MRQGYAVHRLTRGVGDTWFLAGERPALVPHGRAAGRTCRSPTSRPTCSTPSSPSRTTASTRISASIRSRSAAPSSATSREPGSLEGGSTLTQQLARTLFLSNRKTYGRKLREAVLAVMIDAQLSKEQILELYLNRIYLSAGVYGVETMSRHLFGKPAKQLTLAGVRAHRRAGAVAGRRCRPGPISTARWPAATSCSRACARKGSSPPARSRRRGARACASVPIPARQDARAGYAKEFLRQPFRDDFGGDHPPDWDVRTTFVPELQDDGGAGGRATACGGSAIPELQAALVAHRSANRRHPRAGRRPRLPAVAVQPRERAAAGSRARRSSRCSTPRRSSTASRPCRCSTGWRTSPPQGPEEWSPRNADGEDARRADAARRAARVEQPRRDHAAAAGRARVRCCGWRRTSGCADMPDVPSLSLGTGLVTPLELTAAFAMFPNGGLSRAAARHRAASSTPTAARRSRTRSARSG